VTAPKIEPWLTVVGMGEDGLEGLSPAARAVVEAAELIVGSDRLLALLPEGSAERQTWPSPFDAMASRLKKSRGRRVVVVASGDPLNYGVGRKLLQHFAIDELRFLPHVSAFSLAAARLGWSLPDVETLSLHGRSAAGIEPAIAPGARILALTAGEDTVREVARRLVARGYGGSALTVLEHMGGPAERRFDFTAEAVPDTPIADLTTLAIECVPEPGTAVLARVPGLPDDAFRHDGQITKREVRAVTLAALAPYPQALLWDVGAGSGSVAIEWMRAARNARAVAFERHAGRLALIAENAADLGTPSLEIVAGDFLDTHPGRPRPDAVFLGGGVSDPRLFEAAWEPLKVGGRFVANAVTLDGEARLAALNAAHGGELVRIEVAFAEPVGQHLTMRPRLGVTQWRAVKA
jgi:precorrin-6B C5,15-methyltransferase / cobalt-precorrin-6B C5,C15-methyltransferase